MPSGFKKRRRLEGKFGGVPGLSFWIKNETIVFE